MNESIYALQTCFAFFLLWAFWHFGWKVFALEQFRQNLLSIRCDLFELAAKGEHGLTFTLPVYVELRRFLNGRIRFAHRISFAHIITAMVLSRLPGVNLSKVLKSFKTRSDVLIALVEDKELQKKLQKIDQRAGIEVFKYVALTSPIFVICSISVLCYALLRVIVDSKVTIKQEVEKELGHSIRAVDSQIESLDSTGELDFCPA